MRTTWNGSVSFGLVNIPVGLTPATKAAARQSDVSFRLLHRECGSPIKQKRWCPVHERDVESDELVKGWEVSKGQFVIVEDADLEAIEQRDTSRSIDISRFVRLEEVDPIYFDRTYFLVPAGAEAQRRPYVLLLEAMKQADVAALGRFVLAGKEKLALIRPMGDALALETLFVHEDVKDHAEIDEAVSSAEVKAPELDLAKQIIASLAGEFDPDRAAQRVPRVAAGAARGEARRAGDRDARAVSPDARRRPDGGAARVRRGRVEEARRSERKGRGVLSQEDGRGPEVARVRSSVLRGQCP